MVQFISAQRALLFRITHIENVPWILNNGLHCKSSGILDPNFVTIGNPELISKRTSRDVPIAPGGTLSDYIPFYFTPFSMMMYNIHTGYGGIRQVCNADIVIMVTSLRKLAEQGIPAVYTDRHAYLRTACFFSSLNDIDVIDWQLLRARDFRRDNEDPEKTDRYQAEALIYSHLPVELLSGIVSHGEDQKEYTRLLQKKRGFVAIQAQAL
ncbi:MAG: DUF4433 domain-containing protein, partial [Gammaproteobacteria bacterium]|nr:DUF4433 domain-containing protein [Gammaproteobacteria bacterium]